MKPYILSFAWLIAALVPTRAHAQQMQGPLGETAADYRFQLGPLGLAPTLVIDNLGVESNAQLTADAPVKDFTVRMRPGVSYLLPMRRFKLYGNSSVNFTYYQKTADQRSTDTVNHAALAYSGNRFGPRVFGAYGNQRTRPNAEIEAMVGQEMQSAGVGTDYKFSPRFLVEIEAAKLRQFFEHVEFRGGQLDQQLDRTSDLIRAGARLSVTPLTTVKVDVLRTIDRFHHSSERDAESTSLLFGFETKPSALIAGTAAMGYRSFDALSLSVPDYGGLVADVGVSYTLLDRTRFSVTGRRNLEYSSEVESPYYIITSGGLTITQMLGHGLDVQVGGTGDTLSYRTFIDPKTAQASRKDHVDSVNAGFGFKVGDAGRFGFEVSHVVRRSPIPMFAYEGYRAGVKITYGS